MNDHLPAFAAIDLKRHGVIEASAGTGKTYTIERLVYRIVTDATIRQSRGAYPTLENILVVTFTEKAAGELKTRIRALIAARLEHLLHDGECSPELLDHLGACLNTFDKAAIFTIHGFCNALLNRYPFETKHAFDTELLDDRILYRRVLKNRLRDTWKRKYRKRLPGIIEMCDRALPGNMLSDDFLPELARTMSPLFGDRIAGSNDLPADEELEDRLESTRSGRDIALEKLGLLAAAITAANSASVPQPRSHEASSKRARDFVTKMQDFVAALATFAASRDTAVLTPFKKMRKSSIDHLIPKRNFTQTSQLRKLVADVNAFLSRYQRFESLLAECERLEALYATAIVRTMVLDLKEAVAVEKKTRGLLAFGDMIEYVYRALAESTPQYKQRLQRQYPFAIIDEFQDTTPAQWSIFKSIFLDDSSSNSLYLVGDPKQAIYAFQGCDVNTYLRAKAEVLEGNGQLITLQNNYRSSPELLDTLNHLFALPQWFTAADTAAIRYVSSRSAAAVPADAVKLNGRPAPAVTLLDVSNEAPLSERRHALNALICDRLGELLRDSCEIWDKDARAHRSLHLCDIAILTQKHAEAQTLIAALNQARIPAMRYKLEGLFQTPAALHLAAVCDAIAHPHDPAVRNKLVLTPFFSITYAEFDAQAAESAAVLAVVEQWAQLVRSDSWPQLIGSLISGTALCANLDTLPDSLDRFEHYQQICEYLLEWHICEGLTVHQSARRLRNFYYQHQSPPNDTNGIRAGEQVNAVKILTIHAAKGLQFPVVFIAGGSGSDAANSPFYDIRQNDGSRDFVVNTRNEAYRRLYQQQRDEELRRLFYVALTRAEYLLFVPRFHNPQARPDPKVIYSNKSASEKFMSWCLQALAAHVRPALITPESSHGPAAAFNKQVPLEPALCLQEHKPAAESIRRRTVLRQTSYSSLAHGHQSPHDPLYGRHDKEDAPQPGPVIDADEPVPPQPLVDLPPGPETGNVLHEILEHLPPALLHHPGSVQDFLDNKDFSLLTDETLDKHQIDRRHKLETTRAIYHALTADYGRAAGYAQFNLMDADAWVPEMEFHFSFDARAVPFAANPAGGYVIGYIDLLFKKAGRYFIVDWKSDSLDEYTKAALHGCMRERGYDIQQILYCSALHRWLKTRLADYDPIRHFGGIFYAFLRGMQCGATSGLVATTPTTQQLETEYPEYVRELLGGF
ncbi:MAG: AAA family ATPase [Chitinivibrionales bacterium]|nr:AAA family ATPase [Chitinivibrionales bacterium]